MDLEDEERLDSIVDEFFSFIDDDFHLGSDDERSSGLEENDVACGDTRLAHDHSLTSAPKHQQSDKIDVDNVLDEHFSFLQDEPALGDEYEEFYSIDQHLQQNCSTSLAKHPSKSSNHAQHPLDQSVSEMDTETNYEDILTPMSQPQYEPIYSNLEDVDSEGMYVDVVLTGNNLNSSSAENMYENICPQSYAKKAQDIDQESRNITESSLLNYGPNNIYHNGTGAVIKIPVTNVSPGDGITVGPHKGKEKRSSVYLNPNDSLIEVVNGNQAIGDNPLTLNNIPGTSDKNITASSAINVTSDADMTSISRPLCSQDTLKDNIVPGKTPRSHSPVGCDSVTGNKITNADSKTDLLERIESVSDENRRLKSEREFTHGEGFTGKSIILERSCCKSDFVARSPSNPPLIPPLEAWNSKRKEKGMNEEEKERNIGGKAIGKTNSKRGSLFEECETPETKSFQPTNQQQEQGVAISDVKTGKLPSRDSNETGIVYFSTEGIEPDCLDEIDRKLPSTNNLKETPLSKDAEGELKIELGTEHQLHDSLLNLSEYPSSPGLEKDLEKLHSLDLELKQLESMDHSPIPANEGSLSSFSDPVAEAINSDILSTDNSSIFTFPSNLTLNTEASPVAGSDKFSDLLVIDSDEDRASCSRISGEESIGSNPLHRIENISSHEQECPKSAHILESSHVFSVNEEATAVHVQDNNNEHTPSEHPLDTVQSSSMPNTASAAPLTEDEARSVSATISGVIRRSMRRMKHIRLSGKRNKKKSNVSEETEVRRQLPIAPEVGLPSVRSPSSSAVLLPTILAALTPSEPPRESLPYPDEILEASMGQTRSNSSDYRNVTPSHRSRGAAPDHEGNIHAEETPQNRHETSPADRGSITPETPSGNSSEEISVISRNRLLSTETVISRVSSEISDSNVSSVRVVTDTSVHGRNNNSANSNNSSSNNNNRSRCTVNNNNNRPRTRSRSNNTNSNNNNNNDDNHRRSPSGTTSTSSRLSSNPGSHTSRRSVHRDDPLLSQVASQRSRGGGGGGNGGGFLPPKRSLWPHAHSGLMASMAVTLNMFNISRFAVLGAEFGWQFSIQWFIISLVIGLPLMTFHSAIGQTIGGSVMDMWTISPIFQGVGVGLLLVEVALGIYCCVPLAWLFTYFRDSFDMRRFRCSDQDGPENLTEEINTCVTKYFSFNVPQRTDASSSIINALGSIKFDLSFHIALIWVITFLALSRGVRSYGKVCYLVFMLPLLCYLSVGFDIVYSTNHQITIDHFQNIFINRHSWMAASREAFLVWGLHGAVFQQMGASNKKHRALWRDTTVTAFVTVLGLGLASFCGLVFASVLKGRQLVYIPSSFETDDTRAFVKVNMTYNRPEDAFYPERRHGSEHYQYDNFYVGIRVREEFSGTLDSNRSGYNCIRFPIEIFPGLFVAKEGQLLRVWPPIFYLGLLLFGLAHQLAVWHTVVQGLVRLNYRLFAPWETFITFCTCLFAFSSSILMATGLGIRILYFLDYVIGCVWWIMILQLIMVFAVLFVRGKPYTAQAIAKHMFGTGKCCSTSWITAPVSFSWTIMVPVGLLVLSISSFKTGNYREVFACESNYWPSWTCQLASGLQLFPLLLVPLIGLIQTCRYLANPKRDLFERIQHLYRPPPFRGFDNDYDDDAFLSQPHDDTQDENALHLPYTGSDDNTEGRDVTSVTRPFSDPPPKYTPPPSYSTATGSGIYKFFNHSLRRSVRRLRDTLLTASGAERPDLEASSTSPNGASSEPYIPPPDYSQPPLRGNSPAPPQYATLDPIRFQRALRRFQNGKIVDTSGMQTFSMNSNESGNTNGGTANDSYATTRSSTSSAGTHHSSRGTREMLAENENAIFSMNSPSTSLAASRSFSRSNSNRRSSRLRRSLTSSLRRSARRLALNITTGISGEVGNQSLCTCDSTGLVGNTGVGSSVPARSFSSLDLSTQSEA